MAAELTQDLATLVLSQAKEDGFFDDPMPDEDQRPAEANLLLDEALGAYERGARGKAIMSLLTLAGMLDENGELAEKSEPESDPPETTALDPEQPITTAPEPPADNVIKISDAYAAKELAIAKIKKDRLPIPEEIDGEPPVLPRDISTLSDGGLRSLHSEFNACLARANWLVAVEEADELAARQIADYYSAQAIKRAGQTPDPVTGKAKTVAALEAEAAGDDNVREWRQKQTAHYIEVKLLKALRDSYLGNCERASREWSMRSDHNG